MKKFYVPGILIVLVALFFWSSVNLQEIFFEATTFFEGYADANEALARLFFFGFSMLAAIFAPLSSVPLIPVALVIWGDLLTFALLLLGWLAGGAVAYAIGYYAGYPVVKHMADIEKIEEYQKSLSRKSSFMLILLFRLAMPAEIPGYVLGILRYPFWLYMLATLIAEFPIAFFSIYLSEAVLVKEYTTFVYLIVLMTILVGISFYAFIKKKGMHKTRSK